ncbi:MAG: DUF1080 domain-containing protein [Pseudomonadota bacterium]
MMLSLTSRTSKTASAALGIRRFVFAAGAALFASACAASGPTSDAPTSDDPTSDAPTRDGEWITLFDNGEWGDGLEVWISREGVFPVDEQNIFTLTDDGLIQIYGPEPELVEDALLMTKQDYENYRFVVEYKWGSAQFNRLDAPLNSGILYHVFAEPTGEDPADPTIPRLGSTASYFAPVEGPPFADGPRKENSFGGWTRSIEYQMRLGQGGFSRVIGTHALATVGEDGHYTPAIEGGEVEERGALKGQPFGFTAREAYDSETDWNVAEVIVNGDAARHLINGREVLVMEDFRVLDFATQKLMPLKSGRVGVQAEGAELYVRSIKLLPL